MLGNLSSVVQTKCGMTVELFKALLVTYGDPQLAQWPPPDGASVRHLATVPMPGVGQWPVWVQTVSKNYWGHTRMRDRPRM